MSYGKDAWPQRRSYTTVRAAAHDLRVPAESIKCSHTDRVHALLQSRSVQPEVYLPRTPYMPRLRDALLNNCKCHNISVKMICLSCATALAAVALIACGPIACERFLKCFLKSGKR
ncbi:hypothetical protein KGM_214846 [Danaus plexippus plexippus]|uniref:Uncharacterized protein n=1 Tax=Danaus plexippus plexippus TaxID=278856 RepID=A0A212FKN7_DANPL|nr:hypothetical protein KGM_214846 [Danaus plexippus plexippus]